MAVQAAHVACVIAAHSTCDHNTWATQAIALCIATPSELHDLIVASGGQPWESGARTAADTERTVSVAWFVEPDLYWEPTAFTRLEYPCDDRGQKTEHIAPCADQVAAFLLRAPLWKPDLTAAQRRWPARELGARIDTLTDPAQEIWEYAAELAGRVRASPQYVTYEQRRRAAHLLVKGKEPTTT